MSLLLVAPALACPVCFRGGGDVAAYMIATVIMILAPVSAVVWVVRTVVRASAAGNPAP